MTFISFSKILATCAIFVSMASTIAAQEQPCQRTALSDPARIVYRCANSLVLEVEAAAQIGLVQAQGQIRPASAFVSDKAVLIEVEPGSGGFQILTPHAVAVVRGTSYIVDVTAETTSVFVIRGQVAVSLRDGAQTVVLGPGEGADATAGEPLVSRVWGRDRVNRLLARFVR